MKFELTNENEIKWHLRGFHEIEITFLLKKKKIRISIIFINDVEKVNKRQKKSKGCKNSIHVRREKWQSFSWSYFFF